MIYICLAVLYGGGFGCGGGCGVWVGVWGGVACVGVSWGGLGVGGVGGEVVCVVARIRIRMFFFFLNNDNTVRTIN